MDAVGKAAEAIRHAPGTAFESVEQESNVVRMVLDIIGYDALRAERDRLDGIVTETEAVVAAFQEDLPGVAASLVTERDRYKAALAEIADDNHGSDAPDRIARAALDRETP